MQLAWEDFVEGVFLRYLCGARNASGRGPHLLHPAQPSIAAAHTELIGATGAPFLTWSRSDVLSRADNYFADGEPFATPLAAAAVTLEDAAIVRNAFAHRSAHARSRFRALVRRVIGYIPRGMTTGRFLLTVPPGFARTGTPVIEGYRLDYLATASAIVS
jgi:hypothetical protein